jgi:carnitine O-acetyltransferase
VVIFWECEKRANLWNSLQFNIVSKHLGCDRMSFYLNEAAGDIRDILLPGLEAPKAKL